MTLELDVLVIDDALETLAVAAQQLELLKISSIRTAASGAAAIAASLERPPELVLLDLSMPEMDGLEVIAALAAVAAGAKVCVMTGADESVAQTTGRIVQDYGLHFAGTLAKPFRFAELRAIVQQAAAGARSVARPQEVPLSAEESWRLLRQGALQLHYQPKVRLRDGVMVGVECLARLQHPERGLLPPALFIPAIEASAEAGDFTALVADGAMAQQAAWRAQGLRVCVSINIPSDTLHDRLLVQLLAGTAARHGIDPADITLEVTETRIMSDVRGSLETLTRLRLKGFGIAIDDFGVGSSTLKQLREIPCTEIKIDRMFVHRAAGDRQAQAILASSIALGHELGLQVVAEGVETSADRDGLAALGCDLMQGYYCGRPMEASTLPGWLDLPRAS